MVAKDTPKVWAVAVNGEEFQIRDLPVGVITDIARRSKVSWALVVDLPLADLEVAEAVIAAVCKKLKANPPKALTARTIQGYFVQVDDDMPEAPEGGDVDPTNGDDPATAG